MAPKRFTEDYYAILEVEQTAKLEQITQSYRRLALKFHPDRNRKIDATARFQLLAEAYTTLNDKSRRDEYNLVYPSIRNAQKSRPPNASNPPSCPLDELGQIANIQKSKQDRSARWSIKKQAYDSTIFELQRAIRQLEQKIKDLNSIAAAEAAVEAQKNSWTTWIFSPLYKRVEDSEEEKLCKDRAKQERRIEKDMKERRLSVKKAEIRKEQDLLAMAKQQVDAADGVDDGKMQALRQTMWARQARERDEANRAERERWAKLRKQQREQQEKRDQEAAEALRRRLAEEWKREQEQARERQEAFNRENQEWRSRYAQSSGARGSTRRDIPSSTCQHYGWWPKVQGRVTCPECFEFWTYLLRCPNCQMKACPRCQGAIRQKRTRERAGTSREGYPTARTYDSNFDSVFGD